MKKILIDTSVWISAFGDRRRTQRGVNAQRVLDFLESKPETFEVCKSQRTLTELNPSIPELDAYETVPYRNLDETWEQIEGPWENLGSKWNNTDELPFADAARERLPDKGDRPNRRRDRGICGDAIFAGCSVLLTEDLSDFSQLEDLAAQHGLTVLNLLQQDPADLIDALRKVDA